VKLEGSGVDAGAAAAPFAPSEPDEPVEELEEAVCVAAPAMIEEASSGEIVVVSVLDGEPFVPVERTIEPSISDALSTKKIAGPATCLEVSRSTTLLMRGLLSLVIQRATGPLMPGGTVHCARGMLTANGAPPVIMLQKRFCGKKLSYINHPSHEETYVSAGDVRCRNSQRGALGDRASVGDGEGVGGCSGVNFTEDKGKK
jgi:hypothetical protein